MAGEKWMTRLVGYELFLPAVANAIANKEKDDDQLSKPELKQLVAGVFRDAVIKFMKDSELYRFEVPIDLYINVKNYDIIAPDDYIIQRVITFKEHKTKIPKHLLTDESFTLVCCPIKSVEHAFFAEIAVFPKRRLSCKFDENFLERHYDVILDYMFSRLYAMTQRTWTTLTLVPGYKRDYQHGVNKAVRRALSGGEIIKISTRRLSSHDPAS